MRLSEGQRLVRMQYVSKEVSEALVSQITKGFGIDVNIIFGDIDIVADTPIGGIVAIFDGEPVRIDAALNYLRQRNIAAEVLKEGQAAWCVPAFGGYSIAIAYKRALTIAIPLIRWKSRVEAEGGSDVGEGKTSWPYSLLVR